MTLFFYGPNTYELRHQLGQMVDAYRTKTGSDMGLERIDGATVTFAGLMGALGAAPFLVSSRLVVVEGLSANKPVAAKLAELLGKVPSTTVAVFVERQVDQRTAVFKLLKGCDKVMKFEPLVGSAS
jgi:DNA polymerase-3 subunit delta